MNQNGFATSSLLTLLPLLLSIAAFAAGSFLIMNENRRALFECRAGLMDAQEDLLNDMDKLLKLNPQARALKFQRAAAQAGVAAAVGYPLALPAAQATLQAVVAAQRVLDLTQRGIITSANLSAARKVHSVSQKVSDQVSAVRVPQMSVAPKSPDLAPEYEVTNDIEQRHTIKIAWIFHPLKALPNWLNKILEQRPLQFTAECSTTSEKGESTWKPRLKRDKPWSNLPSFSSQ